MVNDSCISAALYFCRLERASVLGSVKLSIFFQKELGRLCCMLVLVLFRRLIHALRGPLYSARLASSGIDLRFGLPHDALLVLIPLILTRVHVRACPFALVPDDRWSSQTYAFSEPDIQTPDERITLLDNGVCFASHADYAASHLAHHYSKHLPMSVSATVLLCMTLYLQHDIRIPDDLHVSKQREAQRGSNPDFNVGIFKLPPVLQSTHA